MNRILVTGLALGNDAELDACQSCNYDLTWLFANPSTLLWADKIILTPEIQAHIKNSYYPDGKENLGKAIRLIFERLEDNGLIEIRSASDVITKDVKDEIFALIEAERERLALTFPRTVKLGKEKVPGQIFINDAEYCAPSVWTMYASFILAKKWDAGLLLPRYSQNYFETALRSIQNVPTSLNERLVAFDEIIKAKLPEQELLPMILFDAELCKSCGNFKSCDSDVLGKVEENIRDIMTWRSYDEVYGLKSVIARISKAADDENIPSTELVKAFKADEQRINKSLNSVFPKVERWSNMATVMSIPVAVAGISTGSATLTTMGAGVAGIATVANKYLEIVRSKYRWVGHKIGAIEKR
jgi:hypothetical protein